MQRGFKVYREVCAICHGLIVAFRNLDRAGRFRGPGQALAAEYKIMDGPNDQGDMFERPGRPADHFPPPFKNDNEARSRFNGVPPDMSVLAKARTYERGFPWFVFDIFTQYQEQGVDYIEALMAATRRSRRPASRCRRARSTTSISRATRIAMPTPLSDGRSTIPTARRRRSTSTPRTSPRS